MSSGRRIGIMAMVIGVVFGLLLIDLLREPVLPPWDEIALDVAEKLVLVLAMGVVAWTVHGLKDLRDNQAALSVKLASAMAQGDAWRAMRRQEIAALGAAIQEEFRQWRLTAAEADVAGLMLKGVSQKDIALLRATSEATIRQQAQSIYRKSGLSGRTELAAYFLESLFATAEDSAARRPDLTVISNESTQV